MSTNFASPDAKAALTRILGDLADGEKRKQLACGGEGVDFSDIPGHLEGALRVMSEDELLLVSKLKTVLEAGGLYDEDPQLGRVYYL